MGAYHSEGKNMSVFAGGRLQSTTVKLSELCKNDDSLRATSISFIFVMYVNWPKRYMLLFKSRFQSSKSFSNSDLSIQCVFVRINWYHSNISTK